VFSKEKLFDKGKRYERLFTEEAKPSNYLKDQEVKIVKVNMNKS
jgi:hypothetical protein